MLARRRVASGTRFAALALLLAGTPSAAAPKPATTVPVAPRAGGQTQQRPAIKTVDASLSGALDAAIEADRPADVRTLASQCVEQGGDPCNLGSALIRAVRRARPNVAVALLQAGTPSNVFDDEGESALALAAERGNATVVGALLRAGANPEIRLPPGDMAMHRAAAYGRGNIIDLLVTYGADVNPEIRSDFRRDGWTPLMVAAAEGQLASIERLLAAGAQVDTRNAHGRTALFIASWYGSKPIVERLVRAGADPAVSDAIGMSPRDAARFVGDPVIVSYLRAKTRN